MFLLRTYILVQRWHSQMGKAAPWSPPPPHEDVPPSLPLPPCPQGSACNHPHNLELGLGVHIQIMQSLEGPKQACDIHRASICPQLLRLLCGRQVVMAQTKAGRESSQAIRNSQREWPGGGGCR